MKHFTHFRDLSPAIASAIISRARVLKGGERSNALANKLLGLLFMDPSLRTRTSFDAAATKLGGQAIPLDVGQGVWGLEFLDNVAMNGDKPEHVREAAGVLSQYVDILGVRAFSHGEGLASDEADRVIGAFRNHAKVPVISLESAREHPCQGLADLMTALEDFARQIGVFGRTFADEKKQRLGLIFVQKIQQLRSSDRIRSIINRQAHTGLARRQAPSRATTRPCFTTRLRSGRDTAACVMVSPGTASRSARAPTCRP